jgi:hypothetical protein
MQNSTISVHLTLDQVRTTWEGLSEDIEPVAYGDYELSPQNIEDACELLLGANLDEVRQRANQELIPNTDNPEASKIHLVSATGNHLQVEREFVANRGYPEGINPAIVQRNTINAVQGDFLVINGPARQAVDSQSENVLDVGNDFYYYTSQALIAALASYEKLGPQSPHYEGINRLVNYIVENRGSLSINMYTMDDAMQIICLKLKDMASGLLEEPLDHLLVEANSRRVADFNTKRVLYNRPESRPDELTQLERLADGERLPRVPGFFTEEESDVELALARLKGMGLTHAAAKATESTDGSFIEIVSVDDTDSAIRHFRKLAEKGIGMIVEAGIKFPTFEKTLKSGRKISLKIVPAGHVESGKAHHTPALQMVSGTKWEGNVMCDERHWVEEFGFPREDYDVIIKTMEKLAQIQGMSVCGVDFAYGELMMDGNEAERVNGVGDNNFRKGGAETMRTLERELDGTGTYAATKVIKAEVSYERLSEMCNDPDILERLGLASGQLRPIASVSPGWAMIAVIADSPLAAMNLALEAEDLIYLNGSK